MPAEERRHFSMTLPHDLFDVVARYKNTMGHESMSKACQDLLLQAIALDPFKGTMYAARSHAIQEVRDLILPRYIELTRQILNELEEAVNLRGQTRVQQGEVKPR